MDFEPPKLMLPGVCVWSEKAELMTQSLLCRIKSKTCEWEKRKKKKDLFLYKGYFIPCLCLLFCGLSYMEAYLTRQEAIQNFGKRSCFWHLGNRRLFFAISSPSLQDGNVFSLLLPTYKKKKKRFELLSFVPCGLFNVLSWTEKKLLKK